MSAPRGRQVDAVHTHDVLVVGSGVAGLAVALETSALRVGLLTKTALGAGGSSPLAQGGVAAAIGAGGPCEGYDGCRGRSRRRRRRRAAR